MDQSTRIALQLAAQLPEQREEMIAVIEKLTKLVDFIAPPDLGRPTIVALKPNHAD